MKKFSAYDYSMQVRFVSRTSML